MNAFDLSEKYAGVYFVNAVLLALAFFVSRIATIPYFWIQAYGRYDDLLSCDWKIAGFKIRLAVKRNWSGAELERRFLEATAFPSASLHSN